MRSVMGYLLMGLCLLLMLSTAVAQPRPNAQNRVERWNDMWMNFTNYGFFGNDGPNQSSAIHDPCPNDGWAPQCELPGGSGQQYLFWSGIWIGALVEDNGQYVPRVSVGTDGWLSPSINEFWPGSADHPESAIIERSRLDTVNCFGDNIHSTTALADHEFTMTFADTLTDPAYVVDDPEDGAHRPLGIKVTQNTFAMMSTACNHIWWIHYVVENISASTLRDVYFGEYVDGDVGPMTELDHHIDDITGFEPTQQIAYIADNDGRAPQDGSGNDFTAPNVTGMMFLRIPEGAQRVSFNWWNSNGDTELDNGPSWEAYADRDSLGMGWTAIYGTPMGDLHKYQLLSNGEHDYDQVRAEDTTWIRNHPQDGHQWSTTDVPPNIHDVANGFDTRYLMSFGPLGNVVGDHTELAPGESFDVWMAYVGGLNFHDPEHPQPTNVTIDPTLFDFTDLVAKAQAARAGACFNWAAAEEHLPQIAPADFALEPVYPNPFNSTATIRFSLAKMAKVEVVVFDVLGREVSRIASGSFEAGHHSVSWNAEGLSSGLYFVQARAGNQVRAVQKAMLMK